MSGPGAGKTIPEDENHDDMFAFRCPNVKCSVHVFYVYTTPTPNIIPDQEVRCPVCYTNSLFEETESAFERQQAYEELSEKVRTVYGQ